MTITRRLVRPISAIALALAAAVLRAGAAIAEPQSAADTKATPGGSSLFTTYCASCHGTSARGDGPIADMMRRRPPDLTEIRRRHRGAFPRDLVGRIIDGRERLRGHGGAGMPVWGDAFLRSGADIDSAAVQRRIDALVDYLEGIQSRDTHD